ncbi:MAG: response regulator [Bacteroidia bacterium]|jgi:CheY-like chemotaxis protein|nr:response regulator [Bacteroidia bacterium]
MKKILLIEDNLEMRENIAEMLTLAGYQTFTAENGKLGLEAAKRNKPNLILCDIMMPELDGYGVFHILSKDSDLGSIPFIFLTAKAEKGDIRKGMNMGADDYLTKPVEETELLHAIDTRLKRYDFFRKGYSHDLAGFVEFISEAKKFNLPENFVADFKVRKLSKRANVYNQDDTPTNVYLINSGTVKAWKINNEGKEFITGIYKKGDFFGYIPVLEGIAYSDSATVLEDAEVALVPQSDFLSLIYSNRVVSARFVKMLADDIAEKEERLLALAYNSVRARTASAILQLKDKYNDHDSIHISRDDLANVVGTSTESLIRTLSEFKSDKLIEIDGRVVKVLDQHGLEKVRKFS